MPSQVSAFVWTPAEQLDVLHDVPAGCKAQAPAPLQVPLVPHVDAACVAHSESGSIPSATIVHVPLVMTMLHASQVPAQSLLQQTPSAQNPLRHWAP